MPDDRPWLTTLLKLATSVEDGVDLVRHGLRDKLGGPRTLRVATYRSYGTPHRLHVTGRVLRDEVHAPSVADASAWQNLVASYRRFETDEVPGARVRLRLGDAQTHASADREGYFACDLDIPVALRPGEQHVAVELVEPSAAQPVFADANVLVPASTARFGVVSDVDDTVIRTDATDLVRMARAVLLGNAHTRLPFPGVAAFYRALRDGPSGACDNPLFYVSSSPWNLYELLDELFTLRDIPRGPLLLRNWGLTGDQLPTRHAAHKRAAIDRILDTYPGLPFVLIGDSGQEDPEIYAAVIRAHRDRVLAAYIRNVSAADSRRVAIRQLATELAAEGGTLVLTEDSVAAAHHAADHGWILPESVHRVADDARAEPA